MDCNCRHPDQQDPDVTPESDDPTRTVIGMAPFYHAYGLIVMCVIIVAAGRRLIVLPKFIPKVFLGAIEKYKVCLKIRHLEDNW